MAGTFYTLQEVAEKLGKAEDEIKNLVKEGKLHEYRDGAKVLFKAGEVDSYEEPLGLDISSESAITLELEETAEIDLDSDEDQGPSAKDASSEGGFGLSQMGDLSLEETSMGTEGVNILGESADESLGLISDTSAATKSSDDLDDLDSLDADANMESFGSGSGLLDLSLQADDTSLGAVLDDILPAGAEGGDAGQDIPNADQLGMGDEGEDALEPVATAGPVMAATPMEIPASAAAAGGQIVTIAPPDPKSHIYGIAMFMPFAALILACVIVSAGIRDTVPGLMLKLSADAFNMGISMIWVVAGGLAVVTLIILAFSMASGGEGKTKGRSSSKTKDKKKKKKRK